MAIDSKNLVGAGLALAIVGIAAWATSMLMSTPSTPAGTIEIRPLAFTADAPENTAPADASK
jgi:hypothetical protein